MQTKTKAMVAGAILASIILGSLVPVLADSNQTTTSAATLIQVAQAAQTYAQQVVTIAEQHGINVTLAQKLVDEGSQLLTQAQSEVNTNPNQATQDALRAMNDFRSVAQSLQEQLIGRLGNSNSDRVAQMQEMIRRAQNKTNELQVIVTKACNTQGAPTDICTDANSNLTQAKTDLSQAAALLSSGANSSNSTTTTTNQTDLNAVQKLIVDAVHHLNQVYADINSFANATRAQQAVTFIKENVMKHLAEERQMLQKANLSASVTQQLQAQLDKAESLLNSAILALPTDWNTGVQEVQQAIQIMTQVQQQLGSSAQLQMAVSHIEMLQKKLTEEKQIAQNATLPSQVAQQVQAQLNQAQSLIDGATQAAQSGNVNAAIQQAQQAAQIIQQIAQELAPYATH